jgi:phosphoenolpyruvate carboxykinase (GTP)
MANLDFLSVPIGRYVQMNLGFGKKLAKPPPIFAVNYFLKNKDGEYVNDISDKFVWLKWMELRLHKEVGALKTPTGFIPKYEDLKRLFREALDREYTMDDYAGQFTLRVNENLAKIERITKVYREMKGVPEIVFKVLEAEKKRLEEAKGKHGDYIPPDKFSEA